MRAFNESLAVALGAALGANLRFWIGVWARAIDQVFPWPTLAINVLGSFALGAFSAAAIERGWGQPSRLFFAVGLCGGFTTFSTFSFEVVDLFFRRSWRMAAFYAGVSLALCVAGCLVGGHVGRIWWGAGK